MKETMRNVATGRLNAGHKILAMFMSICMVLTIMNIPAYASQNDSGDVEEFITRYQWLRVLTETFGMEVAEDNYPDNYYSDIDSDSDEYYVLMLATEFGLMDVKAGQAAGIDEKATKEFVAHTFNECMGYMKKSASYTYLDSVDATYADDIQTAIDMGWMDVDSNGYFNCDYGIDQETVDKLIEIANDELESRVIDEEYDSKYQFKEDVKVIPQTATVVMEDVDSFIIKGYNKSLAKGDKIGLVYENVPQVKMIDKVETLEDGVRVTTEAVDLQDGYENIDIQGNVSANLANIIPYDENVKLTYVVGGTVTANYEDGYEYDSLEDVKNQEITAVHMSVEYDIPENVRKEFELAEGTTATIDCTLSDVNADYDASLNNLSAYFKVNMRLHFTCTVSTDVLKAMGIDDGIEIARVPIAYVGYASANLDLAVGGSITVGLVEKITMGVKFSISQGFNIIREFKKEQFTVHAQVNLKAGVIIKVGFDVYAIKGDLYGKTGVESYTVGDYYDDGNLPKTCTSFSAWLYASVGCEAELTIDLPIEFLNIDKEYEHEIVVYDANNSPVRVYYHYEDGKAVNVCSRGNEIGYITPGTSPYGFNGNFDVVDSDGKPYQLFEYETRGDSIIITKYNGRATALSIPSTYDGYTVQSIGESAFEGNEYLVSVYIPDSVETMGEDAFYGCSNLVSVRLSSNLQILSKSVFKNCTSLRKITIPKGITETGGSGGSNGYSIPFGNCPSLTTVVFEDGITSIPAYICHGLTGLTSVTIPSTVKTIEAYAFYGCSSLSNITIPGSVTAIKDSALKGCSFSKIVIPNSVIELGDSVLAANTKLTDVTLSHGLTYLSAYLFDGDTAIRTITIPKEITETEGSGGSNAYSIPFKNCNNLTTIIFEEGATVIPGYICAKLPALTQVVIPDTVEMIDSYAFYACSSLKNISIPSSITSVGNYALAACGFEKLVIPDSVVDLGEGAIAANTKLTDVTLSHGLTNLSAYLFDGDTALKTITIPKEITATRGSGGANTYSIAFRKCNNLTTIIFEEGATVIPGYICAKLPALTQVTIPDTVKVVEEYAFYGCSGLKSVELPYSIKSIEDKAFAECTILDKITISNGVKKIANNSFYNDKRVVIYAQSDSYAKTYADANNIGFSQYEVKATAINVNDPKITLDLGETHQIVVELEPANTTKAPTFKSSNESVVTVTDEGFVKAVGIGEASIRVSNTCGLNIVVSITVRKLVDKVTLDKSELSLEGGDTASLVATVKPDNAGDKSISWHSDNPEIASVDSKGKVTAIKKGTTTIIAMAADGGRAYAECSVTVLSTYHKCTAVSDIESAHNYSDESTDIWVYKVDNADALMVTFDSRCKVDAFDKLEIIDSKGNVLGNYNGSKLAGKTITVTGDTLIIRLDSDEMDNEWGFKVTKVETLDHEYTSFVSKAATYFAMGERTYKCSNCGDTYTKPIAKKVLGNVTNLKASSITTTSAKLSWSKVTNASGYAIYRYNTADKKWVYVKAVTTNNVTVSLNAATTYKFGVKAYVTEGGNKAYSQSYAQVNVTSYMTTVSGLKANTVSYDTVSLSWNKIANANGYFLYEYSASTKKWTQIREIASNTNTYIIRGLTPGTAHKYAVLAYKKVGTNKVKGNVYTSINVITKLKNVATFKATSTVKGKVNLSWSAVSGAQAYTIYAYNASSKVWKTVKKLTARKLTLTGYASGKTVKFAVVANKTVSGKNTSSATKKQVSIKVK